MAINGLELVTPTSVDKTGTGSTATINANGSVTFSACTKLSLNGVFTSAYRDYMVVMRWSATGGTSYPPVYLRAAGTDATGSGDYNSQEYDITGTAENTSTNSSWYFGESGSDPSGIVAWICGPYLSQPTSFRTVAGSGIPALLDLAGNHELSSSYDGLTLNPAVTSIAGLISVYGLVF